jgi:glycosyltransferase involved in cell wall biosynthesis
MLKVITFSGTGALPVVVVAFPDGLAGEPPHAVASSNAPVATAELMDRTRITLSKRTAVLVPQCQAGSFAAQLPTVDEAGTVENTAEQARHLQSSTVVPAVSYALDATVLICTYNRATRLEETLDSLARCRVDGLRWDVLVVDNNSTDDTRQVVTSRIAGFPVSLRYLFEPMQGKSNALNTGLAATDAALIAFTDDDVRVDENWVDASCRPLLDDDAIDYTGGPVLPIWEQPAPKWLDQERADLWGTLAILDYGREPFIFEDRHRVPLGANMAVRRSLINRVGGFDPDLGRRGNSLLGQEQAEFFCRSRAAGARGAYVPEAALQHHVPARRLTHSYFRRWWYWKGVAKARLEQRHPVTEMGVDLSRVRRAFGVPRFMVGSAIRDLIGWLRALATFNRTERKRRAMMLCYFVGYVIGTLRSERETRRVFYSPATDKR